MGISIVRDRGGLPIIGPDRYITSQELASSMGFDWNSLDQGERNQINQMRDLAIDAYNNYGTNVMFRRNRVQDLAENMGPNARTYTLTNQRYDNYRRSVPFVTQPGNVANNNGQLFGLGRAMDGLGRLVYDRGSNANSHQVFQEIRQDFP